jgi:hypothetical protein
MHGERNNDCDGLMAAYGIGRRLATRIVALLARQVDVTRTLLAEASRDEALERMLLSSGLLKRPWVLTEEDLKGLAAECGYREAELLRLVHDEATGWRTLALEDDLLAREAGPMAGGGGSLVRADQQQISTRETRELFTPEEVARLKLEVLTSQNLDQRVESLRKLVFAPMDEAQKAGIFLSVLTDREAAARVRREAVRSLEQIGFRSDMAEAVRGLFQEDREQVIYYIQRLAMLLKEAEVGEAALVLAVILEVFDQAGDAEVVRELLELIGRSAATLVGNYHKTEQFVQSALRHLARDFDERRADVEGAIMACAADAPGLTADLLWRELKRTEDARVRSLLICLVESLVKDGDRLAELARMAVEEILNPSLPESEKARLRYGLVRLGEPAVLVALDRLAGASGVEQCELVRLADVLCTESKVSDGTVQRAAASLVDLLKVADSVTRRSILRASLLGDRRVDAGLQQDLAGELLALMTETHLAGSLDLIQNTLERIGLPAAGPAYEFMRRAYPSESARRAALALGRIVQNRGDGVPDAVSAGVLDLCMRLLEDERVEDGAFTIPLAAVCGHTRPGTTVFDSALRQMKGKLWRRPYSMDALDALGIMAGSPNAGPRHHEELFELFDGIVRFQARSGLGEQRQTEDGLVYEFGREIEFDVRVVPAAVKGLERLCVSPRASQELRTRIVKRFLILWEGVAKVRIIWGPAAIEALIGAMCNAAVSPLALPQIKVRLCVSLLRFLNKIGVVRSIGQVCSQPDPDPAAQALAIEAGTRLLNEWEDSDAQDVERRLALLDSAGRTAANPALDAASEEVQTLRERALQGLFSGLREGMMQVREPLLLLRECPGLSPERRRDVDDRLSKAFGLVRVGRRQ